MNHLRAPSSRQHLLAALAGLMLFLSAGLAQAQAQASVTLASASIFEGPAGTRFMDFPITFNGVTDAPTTVTVNVGPLTGNGFTPATGGAACGLPGIDFVQFPSTSVTVPAGSTGGGMFVRVQVCGDATIEPDEHLFATVAVAGGAHCTELCAAIGIIRNDDGTPTLRINDVTVTEPLLGTRSATFTISTSFPLSRDISVTFATRNGTATAGPVLCLPPNRCGDYAPRIGTLTIPAGSLAANLSVSVRSDGINEPDETFFVDLSNPVEASLADATGRGLIKNASLTVGGL